MKNDSSPGPDGFGPAFFKFFWNLVNPSLVTLFEEFYENTADLQRINKSHIVLLPKKVGVIKPDQFRPISLQSCPLKLIAKVLTTRLQPLVPQLFTRIKLDLSKAGAFLKILFMRLKMFKLVTNGASLLLL